MEKQKIIAKFNIKDYNRELEKVLQNKSFSKLSSNLLLNMFYKIENSYEDYQKIKVEVPTKKDYIEELLKIIENDCNDIKIVKMNSDDALELKEKSFKTIKKDKAVITYQNELFLLKSLYNLNNNKFETISIDSIRNKAISKILNEGEINFKCEVIRDFDGWSWNINTNEIRDKNAELLYQIMVYLIGFENLTSEKEINIKTLEKKLCNIYKPQIAENIMKLFSQIAIINYLKTNKNDIEELINIKKDLIIKKELFENKKQYIENITREKKELIKQIKKIDKYINNDLELKREYIKQNEKLPRNERIFSLSDFSDKVQLEREEINKKIQLLTELLKPQVFLKEQTRVEKNLKYIEEMDLINLNDSSLVNKFIELFLKAFNEQINRASTKKEILEKIYELRYINLFYINNKNKIGDICKNQIKKISKNLITIACNLKAITIFSRDVEENFEIYKSLFNTRIIDLDNVNIVIKENNTIQIFDENSLEKEEKIKKLKEVIVKYKKKIKVFI